MALRDGSTVHVRPVRAADQSEIRTFLEGLSPESTAFRFFGTPNLNWVTHWSVDVDYENRFALVAESGSPPTILAHAAYVRAQATPQDDAPAEVAFMVADAWQGRGISTILLAHLAEVAAGQGIRTFIAEVLPANHRMIDVFRESGFPVELHPTPDSIAVRFPTSLTPDALERFRERDRIAAIAAVRSVLEPKSVAVIGASRRRGTVGGELLHNLVAGGFEGALYPVNDSADVVQSLPAYRSIAEVPGPVELAVVVVPAEQVLGVVRDCAAAGVRALLVISSGFAETGAEGAARQLELLNACRAAGIRIVGPNCFGVLNTARAARLNATFAPHTPTAGRVGFLSQSGGVGIALIEAAGRLGLGLSSFVSVGNKVDLSGNDFLQYWEQDEGTDLALLYLESLGNPRRFARIAPRFARIKPLVAVKSGRSQAGARATSSHTGALLSASDVTVDTLFQQAGVIRTDTLHDLFGVAALLGAQPVPAGDRVAIVTNGGGPGVICADACQAHGVQVPQLPARVRSRLAEFLPASASLGNPVDMVATASPEDYRRTISALLEGEVCDALIAIFVPALITDAARVATALREAAKAATGVTFAGVFMSREGIPPELKADGAGVPGYEFPEDAARAVALAARHGRWRSRPPGLVPTFADLRPTEAAAIISRQLADGPGWLPPDRVMQLLNCYGVPLITTYTVADADAAVAASIRIGAPVALKAIAPGLIHKTDVGGVRLNLDGPAAVRAAAVEIESSLRKAKYRPGGFVVQPMAHEGVELIIGVVNDHSFGPVLACGAGGVSSQLLRDVAVRITPVSDLDAAEMLRSLRTFPLLDGYRGAPRCDLEAIEQVLLRVSALVDAHPEITELDCNPLIASPAGALVLDARVRVEAAPAARPVPSLEA